MSAEAAFRKSIETTLSAALAPVPIYGHPPANMAMPAVTLDRIMAEPDDLLGERQTRITITFTTWSNARGPRELEAIHGAMRTSLHNTAFDMADGATALCRWQRDDIIRDADGVTYVGSILIQGVLEHS